MNRKIKCADILSLRLLKLHAVRYSYGVGRTILRSVPFSYSETFQHQYRHYPDFARSHRRQRDNAFEGFRPGKADSGRGGCPHIGIRQAASAALANKLSSDNKNFDSVQRLGAGEFFEKNGLLFLPTAEVAKATGQFASAAPLIEIMAGDPSLRGLTGALETGLSGVRRGQITLDSTARPFSMVAQTIESVLNTGSGTFSWRELVSDKPLTDSDRRSFIEIKPILDLPRSSPARTH